LPQILCAEWQRYGIADPHRLSASMLAALIRAVLLITDLGGAAVMIPLALGFVGWLVIRRQRDRALWLFATIASGRIMVELLKQAVGRARPYAAGHLVEVSSASFPSSHSFGTMLTVVALLWLFQPPRLVITLCLAWPIVVGVSRVMLGVHWRAMCWRAGPGAYVGFGARKVGFTPMTDCARDRHVISPYRDGGSRCGLLPVARRRWQTLVQRECDVSYAPQFRSFNMRRRCLKAD
jgi:undecaprenyl-diphosphatase